MSGIDVTQFDRKDVTREYPAARCRGCGVITHTCRVGGGMRPRVCKQAPDRDKELHLDTGWKLVDARHERGCAQPVGRLSLLRMLRDQAPERTDLEELLCRPVFEDVCLEMAAEELATYLQSIYHEN